MPCVMTYFEAEKLSAHRHTVVRSISSAACRRIGRGYPAAAARPRTSIRGMEREPTRHDVEALVGPATPHFAYQLRARLEELVAGLPPEHDVRRFAEEKMELLDRLGYASSKAEQGGREPRSRPGWHEIPSAAPADRPLPRRS